VTLVTQLMIAHTGQCVVWHHQFTHMHCFKSSRNQW